MDQLRGAARDERARASLDIELRHGHRPIVGWIDSLGVLGIGIFVPIALHDHVALLNLVIWSGLVALTTLGWSGALSKRISAASAVWSSALVWAALPWMAWSALDSTAGAWILATVCGYGLATDALLLPQTFRVRVAPLMCAYELSFLLALGWRGHWTAVGGLVLFTAHLGAGVWGFERIKDRLLDNQIESEAQAFLDPLTGLGSRRAAIREIERLLGVGESVHCIIADIDDFKAMNTHLGHHGGDAALVAVGNALADRLPSWFVARLGGDEFIALNRRSLHPSEEGLLTTIALQGVGIESGPQVLSLSLGGSKIDTNGTPDQLLIDAGAALRRAKALGKQRILMADDALRSEEEHRQRIAARAQRALRDKEIVAWGQPIFDLSTGVPAGVELLARWPQPDGTTEMPSHFVPIIEAQGLGSLLGDHMVQQAIALLERLTALGDTDSFVSFNVSALALLNPDLPERISDQLSARKIRPERLILEMTESQRLPSTRAARESFARLRETGVGIASDDVGAGWSSLNQMIDTPFTHVKVDRGLTTTDDRPGTSELLIALRMLAESATQVPIAEGIETPADLQRVLSAGFRLGQGFLLARPAPLGVVLDHFRSPTLDLAGLEDITIDTETVEIL